MGMTLEFPESGPVFSNPLMKYTNPHSILKPDADKLSYIYSVIDAITATKPNHIPLIGFCGSPFTVLLYMLQGLHGKSDFPDAIQYIYSNQKTVAILLEQITELSIEYMQQQINHGIDVFQLFDTHAGLIPFELYKTLILPHVEHMCTKARQLNTPFIYFPKGIGVGISYITPHYCDFLSIDWQTPLHIARKIVHKSIGLQGNIDPRILYASEQEISHHLEYYREFGKHNYNWICNLGHGFMPGLDYNKALHLVKTLQEFDWQRY
jgi:uroporphyrinogen decarboxylase